LIILVATDPVLNAGLNPAWKCEFRNGPINFPQIPSTNRSLFMACHDLWLDSPTAVATEPMEITTEEVTAFKRNVVNAYAIVQNFFPPGRELELVVQNNRPQIVLCFQLDCSAFYGSPYTGGPNFDSVTKVPSDAVNPGAWQPGTTSIVVRDVALVDLTKLLAQDLTRLELQLRFAPSIPAGAAYPQWFYEGVATYVSGNPNCSTNTTNYTADLNAYAFKEAWTVIAADPRKNNLYCQARREVAAYIAARNAREGLSGNQGLFSLFQDLARVGNGVFGAVYGPLLTQ
jgi:hypothetical protein